MAHRSVLDNPINKDDGRVSHSAFAFLFCEMCSRFGTTPTKVSGVEEWENRIANIGHGVGQRSIQLVMLKEQTLQRPKNVLGILDLICNVMWIRWFGCRAELQKPADPCTFYIVDNDPYLSKYIRVTSDYTDAEGNPTINFASFVAGVVQGVLEGCSFPAKVTAHYSSEKQFPYKTFFLIEFEPHVIERESSAPPVK